MRVFRASACFDGRALKKQVIGYGERTMSEIVEAYVNPDLPPEEDLQQGGQGEGIYLPAGGSQPQQVQGLGIDELKAPAEQREMLTILRKGRLSSSGRD